MLAKTFKSAKELNLSDNNYKALVKTLELLEGNKIRHVEDTIGKLEKVFGPTDTLPSIRNNKIGFNMDHWVVSGPKCGTISCIGGTAEILGAKFLEEDTDDGQPLAALFYPYGVDDWTRITPAQAAVALRSYLTTGQPSWDHIPEVGVEDE